MKGLKRGQPAPERFHRAGFQFPHPACATFGRHHAPRAVPAEVAERPAPADTNGAHAAAQPQASTSAVAEDLARMPLPTSDESDKLLRIRHSCAHVMAMAMQRVLPGTQVTVGPAIERGFYYDFDMSKTEKPFSDKIMKKAQKEMRRLIRKDLPLQCEEMSVDEARQRIQDLGEPYKLEILGSILEKDPDASITIYHIGRAGETEHWWDLCAGPHVTSTGAIDPDAVELERSAGAYWRGDEGAPQLTRVYGTAWESAAQLAAYRRFQEEAARRDHRKLGAQLGLFSLQDEAGGGLVFWQPKGAAMRNVIESFWKELHVARGYDMLYTPHIAKADLWKTSGHYDFYGENMYDQMQVEDESYQLRPMNCPFHVLTFKQGFYSYRDLPLRWAELGTVYRYERSGTMHGLFRVRGFTQDDGHIFCTQEQIQPEIAAFLDLVEAVLDKFGFTKFEVNLSTRPEGSIGSDEVWDKAETALKEALTGKGWPYVEDVGGGAFYGPKIDIKIEDAIGRMWQCSTMQLDFNLPERFDIHYVAADNEKTRPIMLHRAIFGSIERFFGILIENYAGAFPAWLAPVQCRLLPVNVECEEFCEQLQRRMKDCGVRVDMTAGEKLGKMIRNAELAKIPVVAVIGPRDIEADVASVRTFADGEIGQVKVDGLVERLVATNTNRSAFDTSGIAAPAAAA